MNRAIARIVTASAAALCIAAYMGCDNPGKADPTLFRAGLATDAQGLNDRSFNALAKQGLDAVGADMGFTPKVRESAFAADYVASIQRLVQDGSEGIVTVGSSMTQATGEMAAENPEVTFAIVDGSVTNEAIARAPNVQGILFKEQEAGYLAGYLAARVAEAANPGKTLVVGAVGGRRSRPADRYLAGYTAGAQAAVPNITVLVDYAQDVANQQACRRLSLLHIQRGSMVEFQAAGECGLGTLSAARDKGVWGIGADADQSYLGDHILTSAVKRVDVAVENVVTAMADGSFTGGTDTVFDLAADGVALGVISPKVSPEILRQIETVKSDIRDGTIDIPDSLENRYP